MRKVLKKKFYRPGTLEVPGTKVSIKTQPYTNGVLFDINDPITSFHSQLITLKKVVREYREMISIPGIADCTKESFLSDVELGSVLLLLDLLIQSPVEIMLKEQVLTNDTIVNAAENEVHIASER